MNKKMTDIKLLVHLKGGKIYDFTSLIRHIKWSGDYRNPSRTITLSYAQGVTDKYIPRKDITLGSTCCFYVGGKEIFRGNCIDISRSNASNYVEVVFSDPAYLLSKDKKSYNFKDMTACDIAKKVMQENKPPLKVGKISPAGTKITKMFINTTGYEIIMSAYTAHSKADKEHKKYMVSAGLEEINIIEKGVKDLSIQFNEAKNIIEADYKESLDSFCNRVLIVDEKGNKISEKVNKDLLKLYNAYISEVLTQSENKKVSQDDIDGSLKGTDKTISLKGIGDISCTTGMRVNVIDSFTNLKGIFYIDKDTHEWSEGHYTISLELNFENLMDEKSAGRDEQKESEGTGSGGGDGMGEDWGHGITEAMINKILKGKLKGRGKEFIKWGNAYKVNPLLVATIVKVECGPGMNSNLAMNHNNFGGITGDPDYHKKTGRFVSYPSVEVGIERLFRLLGKVYIHDWHHNSIESIIPKYAPASDGNNPGQYIADLKRYFKQETGKTWNNSYLGTGVASVEEAHRRLAQSKPDTNMSSGGGSTIDKVMHFCKSYLGTPYSQAHNLRNSWSLRNGHATHFDCSAFCYYAYAYAGKLPKHPANAWTSSSVHSNPGSYGLYRVPLSQIRKGDVLWMSGHLGMYVGGGKVIESTTPHVMYGSAKKFSCGFRFKSL